VFSKATIASWSFIRQGPAAKPGPGIGPFAVNRASFFQEDCGIQPALSTIM